jgi:drug/metabolite transporter (DMT)-like permease
MPARSTRLGYLLAAAAAMWALNGSLVRYLLDDGVSALRLAQLRTGLSWLFLFVALLVLRPSLLRVRREDIPRLAFLGVVGLAGVSATYFLAIDRLEIGVALSIQYLGPMLILLWLRVFHHRRRHARPRGGDHRDPRAVRVHRGGRPADTRPSRRRGGHARAIAGGGVRLLPP